MAALTLNTTSIVSGQPFSITSGNLSMSAGSDPVYSTEERNAGVDAVAALCNGGSIEVATSNAFTTILGTFALNNPAFAAASGGSAALNVSGMTVNGSNTGTATHYRYKTSGGQVRRVGTVGT